MSKHQRDLFKLSLMTALLVLILVTIAFYIPGAFKGQDFKPGSLLPIIITLLILVFMLFFIIRRFKDVKERQPLEDERSKQIITKAAARAFYISIYWLLAIGWFESFFAHKLYGLEKLDASQTAGGGIAGMALIFFIAWFYYNRQGDRN